LFVKTFDGYVLQIGSFQPTAEYILHTVLDNSKETQISYIARQRPQQDVAQATIKTRINYRLQTRATRRALHHGECAATK